MPRADRTSPNEFAKPQLGLGSTPSSTDSADPRLGRTPRALGSHTLPWPALESHHEERELVGEPNAQHAATLFWKVNEPACRAACSFSGRSSPLAAVLGGGVGLASGLVIVLFPAAAIGGGHVLGTTGAGALLGAVAGHAAAGMSRGDLKDPGESLDEGEAGLVVVAVSDMEAKVRSAMKRARKVEEKQLKADQKELEADAAEAQAS